MNICIVYQEDYPWDIRVEKIANRLLSAGHDVFIVCRNESRRNRYEEAGGIKISRLPYLPESFAKLNEGINFPAFFNPLWISNMSKCVRDNKIDLIIVRDLPLALTAIFVGKRYKVPVFLDMAECYPELIRSIWKFGKFRFGNILIRNPYLADLVESVAIKNVDHIFAMVEESKERLIAKGVGPSKVSIVGNSPPLAKFNTKTEVYKKSDGSINMVYAGLITSGRGLDTALRGLSYFLKNNETRVYLTAIGTGDAEKRNRKLAKELGIEKYVNFTGWIDNAEVVKYVSSSDIGLVSHHVCGHWDNTVPNKLFDYMASGIPVLTSNTKAVSRIVKETGAGLVYEDFNPESFSDRLAELTSESNRWKLGKNGRAAILNRYNWEKESEELLRVINEKRKISY